MQQLFYLRQTVKSHTFYARSGAKPPIPGILNIPIVQIE